MSETQEVIEAVERINEKLYKKYNKAGNLDYLPELYYIKSVSFMAVELMIPDQKPVWIWNSESSERKYYEATDTEESMYKCLQRLFREYKEAINKIKF
jgi:hypothetical protein